ncbi:MAG: exopolysaccharide biosynthesis protein [Rhodobacterales bacterium]
MTRARAVSRAGPAGDGRQPDTAQQATRDDRSEEGCETEVGEIVETLHEINEEDAPSVRDIVSGLGQASFGAMLMVPAMLVTSPASGVPALPSACGMIIALIAVQMVLGRDHLWLPSWLMERRINARKFDSAIDFLQKPVGWIDRITRARLTWLLGQPMLVVLQSLCVLCGLAMPVMELVPLTSSVAGLAVCLLAVSFITCDGLFALAGVAVAIAGLGTFFALAGSVVSTVFG